MKQLHKLIKDPNGSIRSRLTLSVIPILLGITLISFSLYLFGQWKDSARERHEHVQTLGSTIGRLIARSYTLGDYVHVEDQLAIEYPRYVQEVIVRDSHNEMVANWLKSGVGKGANLSLSLPISGEKSGESYLAEDQTTSGHVEIKWSDADLTEQFSQKILPALGIIMLLGLASVLAIRRAISMSLKPLDESIERWQGAPKYVRESVLTGPREIMPLLARLQDMHIALAEQQVNQAVSTVASQVAHDIRSPLAALDLVVSDLTQLPEDRRTIIRSAVGRIKDIANNLLADNRSTSTSGREASLKVPETDALSCQLVPSLIDSLITEKRIQYRAALGVEIDAELGASYGTFANIQPTEFKRMLSNLIDNAVEALEGSGQVKVTLAESDGGIQIAIQDNGKGIPEEILPKLAQRGETHGKERGSGLGLHHARVTLNSWGGSMKIESQLGRGTIVTLTILRAETPKWSAREILIEPGQIIVVLDDDTSIHQVWERRFSSFNEREANIHLVHLSTPAELEQWVTRSGASRTLYLIDFEFLGERENGLDVVERLEIQDQSLLVTSRFEDSEVKARCERLGVRLIPKGMAGFVPIRLQASLKHLDCVLIDDDTLIETTWKMAAQKHKKSIRVFTDPTSFFEVADNLDRRTPIFIDSNLGNGVRGELVAKSIRDIGFDTVYLATGYDPYHFSDCPWISAVVAKDPPWNSEYRNRH